MSYLYLYNKTEAIGSVVIQSQHYCLEEVLQLETLRYCVVWSNPIILLHIQVQEALWKLSPCKSL